MSRDSVAFCDQIHCAGRRIVNAGVDDLRRVVEEIRSSRQFYLSLARTSDRDSGMELINTGQDTAIFGCEDSLRGCFGFRYFDFTKQAKLLQVEIYEVPSYAFCENFEDAILIAETFFREGELDKRFSWMIDVDIDDVLKRDNLLPAGNGLSIEAFIAQVAHKV
jgi:hypothetical protein